MIKLGTKYEKVVKEAIKAYTIAVHKTVDHPVWHKEYVVSRKDNSVTTNPGKGRKNYVKSDILTLSKLFPFIEEWHSNRHFGLITGSARVSLEYKIVIEASYWSDHTHNYDLRIYSRDQEWSVQLLYYPSNISCDIRVGSTYDGGNILNVASPGIMELLRKFQTSLIFGCPSLRKPE